MTQRSCKDTVVARPVSFFFVDAEGLQIHFMETIPTHATSLRRLGGIGAGSTW